MTKTRKNQRAWSSLIWKIFKRSAALPAAERWLALEALEAMTRARLMLKVLPFRTAMNWLGLHPGSASLTRPAVNVRPLSQSELESVQRAIRRASHATPLRAVCLQQAIATSILLHRRHLPSEVYFGVTKENQALAAHAWSVCGGQIVTGESAVPEYSALAVFTFEETQ